MWFLVPAAAVLTLWLVRTNWQASQKRTATRAGYFGEVASLFDRVVTQIQPSGFARVTGYKDDHAFDLQAVQDTLTFRKLPALWVMVTLPENLPVASTLDIMVRPTGSEPFSKFAGLPQSIDCPDFLPEGAALRSDNASTVEKSYLRKQMRIFDDPRVKELVISPKGLRLVILAEEADRGRYLIFRDAEMGAVPMERARLAPLIETLLSLRADLFAMKEMP
jgi:hypothetical protein